MNILLIQHLYFLNGSGGTEKICSVLANILSAKGHTVEIATNENTVGSPIFPLDETVTVTNIYDSTLEQKEKIPIYNYPGKNLFLWLKYKAKKKYAKWYNRRLQQRMGGDKGLYEYNLRNRAISWGKYIDQVKPDLIITMSIGSLLEITFGNNLSVPIIDSVNGRPDYDYTNILGGRDPYMVKLLTDAFSKLSGIQILFESYRTFLPVNFKGKSLVIPNPVQSVPKDQLVRHTNNKRLFKIIHIARLDIGCKQQHVAIMAFAKLAKKYPEWNLEFWGAGQDYDKLNQQIFNLGLNDRAFLRGFTKDPIGKMREADICIFPSKYEGFPLALTEAMLIGLPSIGLRYCSGVNELIEHEENGFLAENNEEIVYYLEKLIIDPALRQRMGDEAYRCMRKYRINDMEVGWTQLINSVMNKSCNDE